jgi:2-polyprenyl-3-methyl-5-hydroxy-6-metoxy-1,4-benzoquinol methylase
VTGIDVAEQNIGAARAHLAGDPALAQRVAYRLAPAELLAEEGRRYPLVVASEVVEHVVRPERFLAALAALVAPGGTLVVTTLSRTLQSYALAVVGGGWRVAARLLLVLVPGRGPSAARARFAVAACGSRGASAWCCVRMCVYS